MLTKDRRLQHLALIIKVTEGSIVNRVSEVLILAQSALYSPQDLGTALQDGNIKMGAIISKKGERSKQDNNEFKKKKQVSHRSKFQGGDAHSAGRNFSEGFESGGCDAGGFGGGGFDAGGFDAGGCDAGGCDAGGCD
ncbi:hypothetical protein scyTo_0019197 [Scyliorhinus torazame]|uniref:Uncharacterized protein n=1 Tax=Scyliorhinus torazame TaxID=75743 RepID=A0A401PUJ6_SCYTO|nr:hypothetical protein [Scyliorhinus torazame]